jgi:hypothetical protein
MQTITMFPSEDLLVEFLATLIVCCFFQPQTRCGIGHCICLELELLLLKVRRACGFSIFCPNQDSLMVKLLFFMVRSALDLPNESWAKQEGLCGRWYLPQVNVTQHLTVLIYFLKYIFLKFYMPRLKSRILKWLFLLILHILVIDFWGEDLPNSSLCHSILSL